MRVLLFALHLCVCAAFRCLSAPGALRGARFCLAVSRHDIYRLRRQKEILDAMSCVLARLEKLPGTRNLEPEVLESISIVEVELNADCSHARLKVCIAGDAFQQRQGFSWLSKNTKTLRYRLAQLLRHRKNVPTIAFQVHNFVQQAEVLVKMSEHAMHEEEPASGSEEEEDDGGGADRRRLLLV